MIIACVCSAVAGFCIAMIYHVIRMDMEWNRWNEIRWKKEEEEKIEAEPRSFD